MHIRGDVFFSEDWEGDLPWNDADGLFNVETWTGPHAGIEASEYGIALQKLPTEEELVTMEAQQNDPALDGPLLYSERRSGLRH